MLTSLPPTGRIRNLTLLCSFSLNVLLVLMVAMVMHQPCSNINPWHQTKERKKSLRLTHVIVPFHQSQEKQAIKNMNRWKIYPPCPQSEYQASNLDSWYRNNKSLGRQVDLVFYLNGSPDAKLEGRLRKHYEKEIAKYARGCFRSLQFRWASLPDTDDSYLQGSRLMWEYLVTNKLKLDNPEYVMYMEPDCLPIRTYWLSLMDARCRGETFWIMGTSYQGSPYVINTRRLYSMAHVNGNGLYNMVDKGFQDFYFQQVRPYVEKWYPGESAYDLDMFKYIMDPDNFMTARHLAHHFILSNFIKNYWHSNYTLNEVRAISDYTVLVHGGTPHVY